MVDNNLAIKAQEVIQKSTAFFKGKKAASDSRSLTAHIDQVVEVLTDDIEEREGSYIEQLSASTQQKISDSWESFNANKKIDRVTKQRDAAQNRLEELRAINEGDYPKNISPVLYIIPLLLLGVGEWYVNYTTFAYSFVPAIAIVATIITAVVFASASHVHGSFIKQLGEILHPSVNYRKFIDKKIIVVLVTLLLLLFFGIILWLRYEALARQLGLGGGASNAFGEAGSSKATSKLMQTAGLNFGIWALGTLYAWALSEKVPALRAIYRSWLRENKILDKFRRPYEREQARLEAGLEKQLDANKVICGEYRGLQKNLISLKKRIQESEGEKINEKK